MGWGAVTWRDDTGGSATFALEQAGAGRPRDWMEHRSALATWAKPDGVPLDDVEAALRPPLNLDRSVNQEAGLVGPETG